MISPPAHAPLTPFDTAQTGITDRGGAGRPAGHGWSLRAELAYRDAFVLGDAPLSRRSSKAKAAALQEDKSVA